MQELLPKVVSYYHQSMAHVEGMTLLMQTIKQHFHHSKIEDEVKRRVRECDLCQRNKHGQRVYGEAAPHDALTMPWQEVHGDTIGPWSIDL